MLTEALPKAENLPYDVLVVGGGPAGAVAAAALATRGRRVLLLDRAKSGQAFPGGESLPPLAPALREQLGLGDVLAAGVHLPCYGTASVWGGHQLQYRSFIQSPYGTGWHLDRPPFDAALRSQAQTSGADLLTGELVALRRQAKGGWLAEVKQSARTHALQATWVLDCSGRRRSVSRLLGVASTYTDQLVAHYQVYQLSPGAEDAERLTLVESAPWGWAHTAGLPGRKRIVTLFTDGGQLGGARMGRQASFDAALHQLPHLSQRLQERGYRAIHAPLATDARSSSLTQSYGDGWLAAGDASGTCDPLAAQGILSAVWMGHRAALALHTALQGDEQALATYAEQVQMHHLRLRVQTRAYYNLEQRWASQSFWQHRALSLPGN